MKVQKMIKEQKKFFIYLLLFKSSLGWLQSYAIKKLYLYVKGEILFI